MAEFRLYALQVVFDGYIVPPIGMAYVTGGVIVNLRDVPASKVTVVVGIRLFRVCDGVGRPVQGRVVAREDLNHVPELVDQAAIGRVHPQNGRRVRRRWPAVPGFEALSRCLTPAEPLHSVITPVHGEAIDWQLLAGIFALTGRKRVLIPIRGHVVPHTGCLGRPRRHRLNVFVDPPEVHVESETHVAPAIQTVDISHIGVVPDL